MSRHKENCLTCEHLICHKQTQQFAAHRIAGTLIEHVCEKTKTANPLFETDPTDKTMEYLRLTCNGYKFGKLQADSYFKRGAYK